MRIRFQVSYPLLIAATLLFAFDASSHWLLLGLASGIHELGHILAILVQHARMESIRIALTGGDLHLDRSLFAAWSALRDLEKVHVVIDRNISVPFSHTCIRWKL